MRDTCQPFRKAIYDCLNGNVSYQSNAVPIYDERTRVTNTANIFILLSTQQETPQDDNDCAWITKSFLDIEVIVKTASEVTKNDIDTVAGIITDLIFLTRNTTALVTPSGFQMDNVYRESTISQTLSITETESVLRKIIKISALFIEQS